MLFQALPTTAVQYAPQRGVGDRFNRRIGYLRLSLTQACAMRCLYCRPAFVTNAPQRDLMSARQIEAMVRHLSENYGVHKVRLTGGDPTSRADLPEIIETIAGIPGVDDLAMTTHGLTLATQAGRYVRAGLRRVNISLDTLDAGPFTRLTGVDGLSRVLAGIDAAKEAGLGPIKINMVVVRGHNECDVGAMLRFAANERLELRFIEMMPMGPLADKWTERYVSAAEVKRRLSSEIGTWEPLPHASESARRYRVTLTDGRETTIGFITPMSCNFCGTCNRLRLASDGAIYPCLMDRPAGTIRPAIESGFDADEFDRRIHEAYQVKQREHPHDGFAVMTHIGG